MEALTVACRCGSVRYALNGAPAARAHCHCETCRDFYGVTMLSATAWPPEALTLLSGEVTRYAHPHKQLSKAFCAQCGETLFGTNRLGMRVVPNSIAARGAGGMLPADWQPTMHLFYRYRLIDVVDTLTKYLEGWDGPEHQ